MASFFFFVGIFGCVSQPSEITTQCNYESQCANQNINTSLQVFGRGYKSLSNSSVTSTNISVGSASPITCSGAFSCTTARSLIADNIQCRGSHACNGAIYISALTNDTLITIYGQGYRALAKSYVAMPILHCSGGQSCANIYTSTSSRIYASGSYSLYNATIMSVNGITVYLGGYNAGYGTKIFCQSSHVCHIMCSSNACSNLFLQCDGTCDIRSHPSDSNDTVLPMINMTIALNYMNESIDENICDENNEFVVFDDYVQPSKFQSIYSANGQICCRGVNSCQITSIKSIDDVIFCSALHSCRLSSIDSSRSVVCSAYESCTFSMMIAPNLHCSAVGSCYRSIINEVNNLHCSGAHSCGESIISSNGEMNVYFLGKDSGQRAVVNCHADDTCSVKCGGYGSCSDVILNCTGECTVECDYDTKCPLVHTQEPTRNPTSYPSFGPTFLYVVYSPIMLCRQISIPQY